MAILPSPSYFHDVHIITSRTEMQMENDCHVDVAILMHVCLEQSVKYSLSENADRCDCVVRYLVFKTESFIFLYVIDDTHIHAPFF